MVTDVSGQHSGPVIKIIPSRIQLETNIASLFKLRWKEILLGNVAKLSTMGDACHRSDI
jgi:hypothetical protein